MKLTQLHESTGTYVAVKPTQQSLSSIVAYMSASNIPNPIPPHDLHVTVTYSRIELPSLKATPTTYEATAEGLEIWDTKSGRCLVIVLNSQSLQQRHSDIRKEHGATHDFDSYNPHVALSYDVGAVELEDLPPLPMSCKHLRFSSEYVEPLDLDR